MVVNGVRLANILLQPTQQSQSISLGITSNNDETPQNVNVVTQTQSNGLAVDEGTALNAIPRDDISLQNTLLINETLRNLNFSASETAENALLVNDTPTSLAAAEVFQDLTLIQQNALIINETFRNLNAVSIFPTNSLLINETPVVLEAQDIFQDINFIQENTLSVNEILQDLNLESSLNADDTVNNTPLLQGTENTTNVTNVQGIADAVLAEPQIITDTIDELSLLTSVLDSDDVLTPTGVNTPITSPEVAVPEFTSLFEERFTETEEFNPASQPFLLHPDQTPYAFAAYETKGEKFLLEEPRPIKQDIQPVLPTEKTRHIDQLVSSLLQKREDRGGVRRHGQPSAVMPVESIKYMVHEANKDLAAKTN